VSVWLCAGLTVLVLCTQTLEGQAVMGVLKPWGPSPREPGIIIHKLEF